MVNIVETLNEVHLEHMDYLFGPVLWIIFWWDNLIFYFQVCLFSFVSVGVYLSSTRNSG